MSLSVACTRNHHRSTSVMCRTRPSSVRPDGGTACSLSCSAVRPEHLLSSVPRCQSSQASSVSRSPATRGGSGRSTLGAVHVTQTSSPRRRCPATHIPGSGEKLARPRNGLAGVLLHPLTRSPAKDWRLSPCRIMRHLCGFLLHRRPPGLVPGLTPAP